MRLHGLLKRDSASSWLWNHALTTIFFEMKLQPVLREASRQAFAALREAYPTDDFYYFALVTTDDALRPGPSASSVQGLERVVARYQAEGHNVTPADLRWSEADSPYNLFGDEFFGEVQRLFIQGGDHRKFPEAEYQAEVARRFAAMEGALHELDEEGFFGSGPSRDSIVINVVAPGDESEAVILERATRLNPASSLSQLRRDLGGDHDVAQA